VMQKNPSRVLQAQACYTLASLFAARSRQPLLIDVTLEDQDQQNLAQKKDDDKNTPAALRAEAKKLFEQLGEEYGELRVVRKKTYADLARAGLDGLGIKTGTTRPGQGYDSGGPEIGREVGIMSPEIEGLDTNGRPMRLSAFRGNVVVLSFWGDWCPYCRAMYP